MTDNPEWVELAEARSHLLLKCIKESECGRMPMADLVNLKVADGMAFGIRAMKDEARLNAGAIELLIQRREVTLWVEDAWTDGNPPDGCLLPGVLVSEDPDGKVVCFAIPIVEAVTLDGV